jgi:ABC-type glycerol-3-phosphate transport system permease component
MSAGARAPLWERAIVYIIVFGVAFVVILPYVWMVLAAFKTPEEIHHYPPPILPSEWRWQNFVDAWGKAPFGTFFVNSVIVTGAIVVIQLATSTLAAYAFARFQFPLKNLLFLCYLLILMVPSQVTLIPNYVTIHNLGLLDKQTQLKAYAALILPFMASGFGTFLIRQQFLTIPNDLIEAAIIDGAGTLRILRSIMVPLSRAALSTFALLAAMWHWNDFFWPLIVTNTIATRTMPLGLAVFTQGEAGTEWHLLMAAAIFTALPIVVLFLFAQKQFVQGIANVGVKG